MPAGAVSDRKQAYFAKISKLLDEYPKILLVEADNVGSNQMQKIRKDLRGKAVVLMGKNTMMRKAIRGAVASNPSLEALLPYVKGNIGFVFTKDDLSQVRDVVVDNKKAAPAKPGSIAPIDVTVPGGNTGMEPAHTSFFQALGISTKINKGQIEILNDETIIREGEKVGTSEATLLQKLGILPFNYGLVPTIVYDEGAIYAAKVLDLTESDILRKFGKAVKNIAAVGLKIGFPTIASVPHSMVRAYKNVMAVSMATDYEIEATKKIKEFLENPEAFAVATQVTSTPAAQKEEAKVEEKEESDEDMGFGLFD